MQSSDDDASDNSLAEGDSGQVHCSIDNDVINELPTTSENDTSRLDFSQAVQLKRSRNLTDAEKYDFLNNHFVPALSFHFPPKQYGSRKRSF